MAQTNRPMYVLNYRKNLASRWNDGIPQYDRSVVKRDESFYIKMYGEENVRVDTIEKKPKREKRDRRDDGDSYED